MSSPAEDVANYLVAMGVGARGGSTEFSVHVSREPSLSPQNVVTVYDTGGLEPDTDELDILRPTVQVRVRGLVYATVYAKQEEIRDLLILPNFVPLGSDLKADVTAMGDILDIGRDDGDRFLTTANYRIRKERT